MKKINERNRSKPELQKTLTTLKGTNIKKFNEEEFQKLMDNFDSWEKKKKEKIEKLQKQTEEEELRLLKDPETNRDENLKYNINPKNYDITERLYVEDIKKRKDKQEILNKIYTPSFKPEIHLPRQSFHKSVQRSRNNSNVIRIIKNYYTDENTVDEDFYNNEENKNNNKKNKKKEEGDDEESDEESDIFTNLKKINHNNKGRNLNLIKIEVRRNKTEEKDDNKNIRKGNSKNKDEQNKNEKKNIIIEFKLRDLLFKNKKPVKRRNNSVDKRNHVGFSLG